MWAQPSLAEWEQPTLGLTTPTVTVNVAAEGAKGDGVTDDTAAIQQAITAAGSNSIVYFPPGQYLVSSTLTLVATGQKWIGAGSYATSLKVKAGHPGPVVSINGATQLAGVVVQGLSIDLTSQNLITGLLATGNGTTNSYIRDVIVTGAVGGWPDIGFDFQNFSGKVQDCVVANPTTAGYRINGDSSMLGILEDCLATLTDAAVTCADGFLVSRTTAPDNGGLYLRRCRTNRSAGTINHGFRFVSTNGGGTNSFITMTDCIADNVNGGSSIRIDAMHNNRCVNGYFTRSVNTAIAMEISAAHDIDIVGCWLPNVDLQLSPTRINFVSNQMTQGGAAQVVKVDAANPPGDVVWIGNRVPPSGTVPLTNDFGNFAVAQQSTMTMIGHEVLSKRGSSSTQTFAIRDASAAAAGKAKYFEVDSNGNLLIVNDAFTTIEHTLFDNGCYQSEGAIKSKINAPAYGATVTPNLNLGNWQTVTVTNATAFTIAAPTNPPDASHVAELTVEVFNNSGGAMGAITWNAAFVFNGFVWANPANGKRRFARFEWNGANWICTGVSGADY